MWVEEARRNERGFTLPELLTTIAILGILISIAMILWLGLLERWRVESAANQLASDLRSSHSRATNQLTDWRVVLTPDSPHYKLIRLSGPYPSVSPPTVVKTVDRSLPEGTKVLSTSNPADPDDVQTVSPSIAGTTRTVEFSSDGSARALGGASGTIRVSSSDGSPSIDITFVLSTSRIKIGPLTY